MEWFALKLPVKDLIRFRLRSKQAVLRGVVFPFVSGRRPVSGLAVKLHIYVTKVRFGKQNVQPVPGVIDIPCMYGHCRTRDRVTPDVELECLICFVHGCPLDTDVSIHFLI